SRDWSSDVCSSDLKLPPADWYALPTNIIPVPFVGNVGSIIVPISAVNVSSAVTFKLSRFSLSNEIPISLSQPIIGNNNAPLSTTERNNRIRLIIKSTNLANYNNEHSDPAYCILQAATTSVRVQPSPLFFLLLVGGY